MFSNQYSQFFFFFFTTPLPWLVSGAGVLTSVDGGHGGGGHEGLFENNQLMKSENSQGAVTRAQAAAAKARALAKWPGLRPHVGLNINVFFFFSLNTFILILEQFAKAADSSITPNGIWYECKKIWSEPLIQDQFSQTQIHC